MYTHNSLKYGSDNRINSRKIQVVTTAFTEILRSVYRSEQLVANDAFERASVCSSVCEMQENNSELSLNLARG